MADCTNTVYEVSKTDHNQTKAREKAYQAAEEKCKRESPTCLHPEIFNEEKHEQPSIGFTHVLKFRCTEAKVVLAPCTHGSKAVKISRRKNDEIKLESDSASYTGRIVNRGEEDGGIYVDIQDGKKEIIRVRIKPGYVKIYIPKYNHVVARCKNVPTQTIDKLKKMLGWW